MRSQLVKEVRQLAATRRAELVQSVIDRMRHLRAPYRLSGDDSPYVNVWLEYVTQVQGEHSIYWSVYEQALDDFCNAATTALDPLETWVLWLSSDAFLKWEEDAMPSETTVREQVTDDLRILVEMAAGDFPLQD